MSHTYTSLLYHLVWSTKERKPLIDDNLETEMHKYLGGTIGELGGSALLVGGMPDHVHVLAVFPARRAISDIMRDVKANSSGWVHDKFPELREFAWQTGYGAFSVSPMHVEAVREYIRNQTEHHRQEDFQTEFRRFCEKNGRPVDERFVWD